MVLSTAVRPEIITHVITTKYEKQQDYRRWFICYVIRRFSLGNITYIL